MSVVGGNYTRSVRGARHCATFLVSVLLALLAQAVPAGAQPAADEYRETIDTAVAEYKLGNWHEARTMFKRAHELDPSARTWRGMGLTAFELRLYVEAIRELETSLADSRKPLAGSVRSDVERTLAQARSYAITYQIRIRPETATVLVDDRPVELPADGKLLLNPGRHTISVSAPGHVPIQGSLFAQGGEQGHFSALLEPAEPLAGPPADEAAVVQRAATQTAQPHKTNPRPFVILGLTTGAVGLALAGASIGLAVVTKEKDSDYRACNVAEAARPGMQFDCQVYKNKGMREQRAAIATGAVAGVLGAVAVVGLVVGVTRKRVAARQQQVALSPFGVFYTTQF